MPGRRFHKSGGARTIFRENVCFKIVRRPYCHRPGAGRSPDGHRPVLNNRQGAGRCPSDRRAALSFSEFQPGGGRAVAGRRTYTSLSNYYILISKLIMLFFNREHDTCIMYTAIKFQQSVRRRRVILLVAVHKQEHGGRGRRERIVCVDPRLNVFHTVELMQ